MDHRFLSSSYSAWSSEILEQYLRRHQRPSAPVDGGAPNSLFNLSGADIVVRLDPVEEGLPGRADIHRFYHYAPRWAKTTVGYLLDDERKTNITPTTQDEETMRLEKTGAPSTEVRHNLRKVLEEFARLGPLEARGKRKSNAPGGRGNLRGGEATE